VSRLRAALSLSPNIDVGKLARHDRGAIGSAAVVRPERRTER
jgi:hypothetical protein